MTRHHHMAPLVPQVENTQDKRLVAYELIAAGAAADPALFIIEEIEHLSESITREI
ncbi:hypothetical protein ABCW43_25480 [Neorhizobium sp. IRAMC:178]|uniref:hypothetical protein n=1 Tax=Neorhizobium tunisiense TaxID=3144793 RepID=UPI0031F61A4E